MFKTLSILVRGSAARAAEELADRNAFLILDQQLRDSTAAFERAKRALALAIAQDAQEGERLSATLARIADLETRVREALQANNQALAREGAEAIAALEADRDAAQTARALFAAEIARLKAVIVQAEQRIRALDRGRRVARATEAARAMRKTPIESAKIHQSTLSEAEATLRRLRERQAEDLAADNALADLDQMTNPVDVAERLAEAGFGPRLKTTADDVLSRLQKDL